MGYGYDYHCKKCGYWVDLMLGVGFLFPQMYEETIRKGKEGTFGEDIREFLETNPDGALDVELAAYRCGKCGRYISEPVLTMYIPKESGKKREKEKVRWSVANSGEGIDYVDSFELGSGYKFYKIHPHYCGNCGGRMRKMKDAELKKGMRCPECGEPMEYSEELWD